jgi:membrane-associated phospholipid phosphatase
MKAVKKIFCVLIIMIINYSAFCQTEVAAKKNKIYHVNYITGNLILAGGLSTDYFAIGRIKNKPNLSLSELQSLNPGVINSLDRWAIHQNPANYLMFSKLSDDIEPPIFVILPALLGFDKKIRNDWFELLFMYIEGHTITFTFYNYSWLGPTFQNKYRPITYYTSLPLADQIAGNNRNSFYSGHCASVAFTTFFLTKVYCDYHPDVGSDKYLLYTAALIPPIIMGYFRVRALAHFPSDCLAGITLGSVIGVVLPELHKFNYKGITLGMSSAYGSTGLSANWLLPSHKLLIPAKCVNDVTYY